MNPSQAFFDFLLPCGKINLKQPNLRTFNGSRLGYKINFINKVNLYTITLTVGIQIYKN